MTVTDELRRLLDERGVAHSDHYTDTSWRDADGVLHLASEQIDKTLILDYLTPEQAVAATFGERTCKVEGGYTYGEHDELRAWALSCGHEFDWNDIEPPHYCPNCGAKVVEE